MHLLETYALSTGSKIKKPFIIKKYFPLPSNKYITIQNSSGMSGKCYDYFQDVIDFLYEKLNAAGYQIIQIGSKEDRPLNKVLHLQGQTDINQTAFILNNSNLHIGNDSFAIHMCSAFEIPLIGLYSVSSPEIAGPFWKNNKQICLTPKSWKPSFNPNESPKKVNEIKIEEIIEAVETLLFNKIETKIKTLSLGQEYNKNLIETVTNQIIPPQIFQGQVLNIRIDYNQEDLDDNDYNCLFNNLNIRNCVWITDKKINLKPFFQLKDKIPVIFYNITNNVDIDFINEANLLGFKLSCIFDLKDNEEILNQRKLDLIDVPQSIEIINANSDFNIDIKDDVYYKSNKILIANNQLFLSKTAYKENKPVNNNNFPLFQKLSEIQDLESFIKDDLKYSLVFSKK
jgi:hypothetical protein